MRGVNLVLYSAVMTDGGFTLLFKFLCALLFTWWLFCR